MPLRAFVELLLLKKHCGFAEEVSMSTTQASAKMTAAEFAWLGGGELAYIKPLTPNEAKQVFPTVEELKGLAEDTILFSLHAADGTPLALTDTWQAALEHATDDDLQIASLH